MHYTKVKYLKELGFRFYELATEMLAVFSEEDRAEFENAEALKKSPTKNCSFCSGNKPPRQARQAIIIATSPRRLRAGFRNKQRREKTRQNIVLFGKNTKRRFPKWHLQHKKKSRKRLLKRQGITTAYMKSA